jgi:hypothetical protein
MWAQTRFFPLTLVQQIASGSFVDDPADWWTWPRKTKGPKKGKQIMDNDDPGAGNEAIAKAVWNNKSNLR